MSVVEVAVAILVNQDEQVLISRRGSHQHQGDKWEFPGGKVEVNESSLEALHREIDEELGVQIKSAEFLLDVIHQYADKKVLLGFYLVKQWDGDPSGIEGQPICWISKQDLNNYTFPDGNAEIISLLQA